MTEIEKERGDCVLCGREKQRVSERMPFLEDVLFRLMVTTEREGERER